jgi:hypothetical protein
LGARTTTHEVSHTYAGKHAFYKDPKTGKTIHFGGLLDYKDGYFLGYLQFADRNAKQICGGLRHARKRKSKIYPYCSKLGKDFPIVSQKVQREIDRHKRQASLPARPIHAAQIVQPTTNSHTQTKRKGFWDSLFDSEANQQQSIAQAASADIEAETESEFDNDSESATINSAIDNSNVNDIISPDYRESKFILDSQDSTDDNNADDEEEGAQLIFLHQPTHQQQQQHQQHQQHQQQQSQLPESILTSWTHHRQSRQYVEPSPVAISVSTAFGFFCGFVTVLALSALAYISCCRNDNDLDSKQDSRITTNNDYLLHQTRNKSTNKYQNISDNEELKNLATEELPVDETSSMQHPNHKHRQ